MAYNSFTKEKAEANLTIVRPEFKPFFMTPGKH
jgi:hypothetical protein